MSSALDKIIDPAQRAVYAERAKEIMREAIRAQGVRAVESTRRITAVHEAGHAIIYEVTADDVRWWRAYRLKIWRAPIPDGIEFWFGHTDVSPKAPPEHVDCRTDPRGGVIFAMRQMAGYVAEQIFCRDDFRAGSSIDEMLVAGGCATLLASQFGAEPEIVLANLVATTYRTLMANETVLMRVANRLEQSRKVEGGELRRLLEKTSSIVGCVERHPDKRFTIDDLLPT